MCQTRFCLVLLVAASMLAAADPSLYIVPYDQSHLSTFSATNSKLTNQFPAGGDATAMVLSPDGDSAYVAVKGGGGKVLKRNLTTGAVLATYPTGPAPVSVGLSPDGSTLYAVTDGFQSYLFAFDTASGAQIAKVPSGYQDNGLAVSPDGKSIYVSATSILVHFDAQTLQGVATVSANAVALAFGKSGVLYASTESGLTGDNILVIDTANDSVTATIPSPPPGPGLVVSPDGSKLYASGNALTVISTATNQVINTYTPPSEPQYLAISPDGKTALCTSIYPSLALIAIDLATGATKTGTLDGGASAVLYSHDGNEFYILLENASDIDYSSESTDLVTGVIRGVQSDEYLFSSLSGNTIAASTAPVLTLIDTASKRITKTYTYSIGQGAGNAVALNSTGTVALLSTGNYPASFEILDISSGAFQTLTIPNSGIATSVIVSPDDTTAYVNAPQLCAIDISTATVTKCGPTLTLAFSGLLRTLAVDKTGTKIFAVEATTVSEYDASTLQLNKQVALPSGQGGVGIAYSPSTNALYAITNDTTATTDTGTVTRIDAASSAATATQALTADPRDVAVSQDGTKVYLAEFSTQQTPILDGTTLATVGQLAGIQSLSIVSAGK